MPGKDFFVSCRYSARALAAGLVALAPNAECGQDAVDSVNAYYLTEAPVVLSATRLSQSLADAPAATTIIDKEMIRASGAREVAELFRLVPGMQVGYRRGYFPSVTYHGMADEFSRGMQVLIDGQSVFLNTFGGVAWTDLPLAIEDIERLEIIRGPNAATYGPNSFMGVINIITSHAVQDQGITAGYRTGEGGYRRGIARYGGSWNDLDYRVTYSHQEDRGFHGVPDDQRTDMVSSRFDYRLTPHDQLLFNFGFRAGPKEIGTEGSLSDPERVKDHRYFLQQMRWEHFAEAGESFMAQFAYNRQEVDDDFFASGRRLSNDQLSERFDLEFQHTFEPVDKTRLVWGAGSRFDRMRLPFWVNSRDDKSNVLYRLFGNFEWEVREDVTVNLGVLLEKNSITGPDYSPRLAVNYRLTDDQSLRFIATRASRTPSVGEDRLDIVQPTSSLIPRRFMTEGGLNAEEVYSLEVGHHGQFLERKLVTDVKLAWQDFRRLVGMNALLIDANSGDLINIYGNTESAVAYNAELQVDYRPSQLSLLHLGYSWLKIAGASGRAFDYNSSAPTNTFNILLSHKFPGDWRASAAYYYRGEMTYLRADPLGEFQRLDLMLEKTFRLSEHQRFSLALIHQNALDANREVVLSNHADNRSFVELIYRFE